MNKKLMIVDDEPDIHVILKNFINKRDEEIEIVSAYSGEEGVEMYKKLFEKGEAPSLVIMDLNLSGRREVKGLDRHLRGEDKKMSGVQATRKILEVDPNATIWGYTAWFNTPWEEDLRKAGAKKVIGRTVTFSDIARMVKDFMEEKQ